MAQPFEQVYFLTQACFSLPQNAFGNTTQKESSLNIFLVLQLFSNFI